MDRPCRQRTFNLGFGDISRAKFWETVKFSRRISQPTPFPTTFILELYRVAYVDILCRQHTFNLGFGVFRRAKFGETVKFSQRIFPPTPFPTTFILKLYRVAYFGIVDLAQRIYFADNALSTFDLEFLG